MRLHANTVSSTSGALFLLVLATLPRPAESFFDALYDIFRWIVDQIDDFRLSLCTSRINLAVGYIALSLLIKTETYISLVEPKRQPGDNGFVDFTRQCENTAVTTAAVNSRLPEMMEKLKNRSITRPNNLGLLRLSQQPFTCFEDDTIYSNGYCGIGLGMPEDDHDEIRPFLDQALGNGGTTAFGDWVDEGTFWKFDDLKTSAEMYLSTRNKLTLGVDAGVFFMTEIHKLIFDITLTEQEAYEMLEFFDDFLQRSVLLDIPIILSPTNLRNQRKGYVERYEEAIRSRIAMFPGLDDSKVKLAAEGALDALIFAGGPSLTGAMEGTLGAYLNGFVDDSIDWTSTHDVGRVVMEVVRVYPPVLGVPYLEDGYRYNSLTGYTGYDKDVWSEDAYSFKIRGNVDYYLERLVSWSDAAVPDDDRPQASHVCPAKSFSFNLLVAFIVAMNVEEWEASSGEPPFVEDPGQGPFFWDPFDVERIVD